jgi:hypothetical protein
MSLRVESRFPGGNVAAVRINTKNDPPEVVFASDPAGGPECLWFNFRLVETEPDGALPQKVTLTLRFFRNMLGAERPDALRPVLRSEGQNWMRVRAGILHVAPDGQKSLSWSIPYPTPSIDVAFCFPYGKPELRTRLQKSKGFWKKDEIGLSQGGRPLIRLSNDYGTNGGDQHGLYMIARQHAGETPGAWILDGMLEHFSRNPNNRLLIWSIPFADIDGVEGGYYGKDRFPYDLNRAWGHPPMRHEALAIKRDIDEWRSRCRPMLMLDLHAPDATYTDGVFTLLPQAGDSDTPSRETARSSVRTMRPGNSGASSHTPQAGKPQRLPITLRGISTSAPLPSRRLIHYAERR